MKIERFILTTMYVIGAAFMTVPVIRLVYFVGYVVASFVLLEPAKKKRL